jgi:hypothetical protein
MLWRLRAASILALLLALPACQAVRQVDEAMRRVDVLDRIFEPELAQPLASAPPLPSLPPPPEPAAAPVQPPAQPWVFAEPLPPQQTAEPEQETGRDAAPEPAVTDPALRTAALLRRNAWLARFWSELTTEQQGRIAQRLQAGGNRLQRPEIAFAWDRMGLDERVRLIYGAGAGA